MDQAMASLNTPAAPCHSVVANRYADWLAFRISANDASLADDADSCRAFNEKARRACRDLAHARANTASDVLCKIVVLRAAVDGDDIGLATVLFDGLLADLAIIA